jgi:DNA-binding NtrC family response regulator
LRNCIERANILAVDDEVRLDESMLLPVAASTVEDDNCIRVPIGTCLAEVERRLILATLEHFGGNKNRTAGALGCSVKTVYNKLNQYRETTGGPTPG